jgi:hypothetical protein
LNKVATGDILLNLSKRFINDIFVFAGCTATTSMHTKKVAAL